MMSHSQSSHRSVGYQEIGGPGLLRFRSRARDDIVFGEWPAGGSKGLLFQSGL